MNGKEVLFFFVIFAAWFALNRWVLPWVGIPTCMSGSCSTGCTLPQAHISPESGAGDSTNAEENAEEAASATSVEQAVPVGTQPNVPDR